MQESSQRSKTPNSATSGCIQSSETNNPPVTDTRDKKANNATEISIEKYSSQDIAKHINIGTPQNSNTSLDGTSPRTSMPMNGTAPRTGIPMNGMTPRTGMPMNGTTPRTGMPMNGTTPRTGMPMNSTAPRTGMPMNSTAPRTGMPMNNLYIPNNSPYNVPMGVPLYPLYGYDNCEDLDRDMNYFKQIYPNTAKQIQREIDKECDQLEYDGSLMFDEFPDRVSLDRISERVYDRLKDMDDEPSVEAKSFYHAPTRRQNLLRDFISIILLNEIFNRRRRYRGRRRWF